MLNTRQNGNVLRCSGAAMRSRFRSEEASWKCKSYSSDRYLEVMSESE